MKIFVLLPLLIVLGMSFSVAQDAKSELRTWTAVNGKEVEAEFVSNSDGQVSLKMKTGKIFKVPLNKLSEADQEFLKAKSSPQEPAKEAPVSPESRIIGYWTLDSEKSLKALESFPESPDRDEVEEYREIISEAAKENVLILNFSKGGKVEIYQGDDADPDSSAYTFVSEDAEAISVKIEDVGSFVLKGDTLQMIPPEGESGIIGCYILSRIDQFRVIKRGNLKYQIVGGAITVTECDVNASGALTIPASIEGNPVTSIGRAAFKGCRSLTSISIPDGVTSIGEFAFRFCTDLTSIEVGAGNVNYTGVNGVLFNAEKTMLLTYPVGKTGANYTIPNSVTSIGESAYFNCHRLTSITIPDSVTSIGDSAFRSCSSLTSITIPNGVTGIRYGAFSGCSSLTSITIPDSVTSIGRYAFTGCSSLIEVTFLGDAPKLNEPSFGPGPTIYRKPDAKGWTDTFGRRLVPVKLISEKPPSPDAKIAQAGKIDLDDPETRKKITARAIVWRMLQRRGRNGKKLLYAPNQKKPYTGWGKAFHDNGQIRNLAQYKDGKKSGSARWWYRNEQKGSETTWMNGKVLTVSGWKPNGEKCPVTNVLNGNGVHVLYKEDGTEKERKTYREGLPVDSRAKAGG